ncbi:sulfate ABC transporter substrate-binding protein [Xinfangfangia sp. CPCC 101601]|uniref:Sulfate ABC transporter substrate-binding protein n=1 Tax=Pseudogemmobacter lacusdianii TaxID=3069608 RepID=A0ABU0W1T1_9RHOB|nr:sulfate ABC transporter substrate-binding protein [Xinfangfangia sp. CPCC 101601]MDQ2067969.1 sulfate ABC transporter substrate-binding protein [Xinfangfangia sp. CPCC 101601]
MTALPLLLTVPGLQSFWNFTPRAADAAAAPADRESNMATIKLAGTVLAQGAIVAQHGDGRLTIADGARRWTGWPVAGLKGAASAIALALLAFSAAPSGAQTLLNVSYDPTRELYREVNESFAAWWEAQGNPAVEIETSHGGSGSQARAVIDGLEAHVVTLALASDIDRIAEAGKLPEDWQSKLPHNSSPYTSTIVFLVREGNPKGLKDWGDLVADGVEVITPNPKTSGGARWNYLAAWAWAEKNGQDPQAFVKELFEHVPVLDSGARGSTNTFAQRGTGDVLLAWENEAYLALQELGEDQFDIVVPSVSVLAEPPIAIVEANIKTEEQRKVAEAYLTFLYTPEGQAIVYKNFYRGWDTSAANPDDVARFPDLELVDISHFGGWAKVQPEHFGDGGIFDQIYIAK